MTAIQEQPAQTTRFRDLQQTVRRFAAVTAAGALLGLLVGGIGGRLAMMLLARLNPADVGLRSDDGFIIGQLTTETFNLMFVGTMLGVFGGGLYFLLRGLMTGPRWFQVLSIGLGPAVVVGSMLVHTEGVDFTALEPAVLGVALFLAIPGVYAALLTVVAERWLDRDAWFLSGRLWLTALPLLLWAPIAPLLGALTVVFGVLAAVRRTRRGAALLGHPASPWLARGALAVVFFLGVADLARDVATLT